jgi:hypothetical protein
MKAEKIESEGERIATQQWGGGSWVDVYKYKRKFYVIDEVGTSSFNDAAVAFQSAGIGRSTYDRISHMDVAPEYEHLVTKE